MEVNNPMMDQLLVNTATQPSTKANANANAPKEADGQDFDSMVHQKRTADVKPGTKDAKQAQQPKADDTAKDAKQTPEAEQSVTDEQYAIAAAMMFQAQPDTRYTMVADANAEVLPEQTVEAAAPVQAETAAELPEMPEVQPEALAGPETEVRSAAVEAPREEAAAETPREAKPTDVEAPEAETRETAQTRPAERQSEQPAQQTARQEAPEHRAVRAAAERTTSDDNGRSEEPHTDDALPAQEATPLFEHVDTQIVKVAEASRPIPLEAENGVDQLAEELNGILVTSADANRVEVTLTPEHLGKLTIEISRGENGALSVVLHASTERAANLLERGSANLQNLLASNTRNDVQVEVRGAEESQQQFLNPDGQNDQNRGQQQQHGGRRHEQQNAQDFLQQLRLGLVDADEDNT